MSGRIVETRDDELRDIEQHIADLRDRLTIPVADSEAQEAFTDFYDENAEWSDFKPRSVGRMREVLGSFLSIRYEGDALGAAPVAFPASERPAEEPK